MTKDKRSRKMLEFIIKKGLGVRSQNYIEGLQGPELGTVIQRPKQLKYWWSYWKSLTWREMVTMRGHAKIGIDLTYRCNLTCEYCCAEFGEKGIPKVYEATLKEWQEFFDLFPQPIREVWISGGEPTLYKELPELVNWLLKRGYNVTLATNLWRPETIQKIKPSNRFMIWSSHHHIDDAVKFDQRYRKLCDTYQIVVKEYLDEAHGIFPQLPYSSVFRLSEDLNDALYNKKQFHVSPDRKLFIRCADQYAYRGERMREQKK